MRGTFGLSLLRDIFSVLFSQVQRIKNEFTVRVYEIHARIALESVRQSILVSYCIVLTVITQNDMVEYNQCQSTLRSLYDLGIPGQVEEFTAYRILMLLHGRNRSGMSFFLPSLLAAKQAVFLSSRT